MKHRQFTVIMGSIVLILFIGSACNILTLPPGNITGTVNYKSLTQGGNGVPMSNVLVLLCKIKADDLPEGPAISGTNVINEHICTLQATHTAMTDSNGVFTFNDIPSATYLVLFHLFPDEIKEVEWDGVSITEARVDGVDGGVIPTSGKLDFWEAGGRAYSIANWSASEGFTVTMGSVCSNKFGICFSISDERLSSIIEVEPNETIEIEITSYFKH